MTGLRTVEESQRAAVGAPRWEFVVVGRHLRVVPLCGVPEPSAPNTRVEDASGRNRANVRSSMCPVV